MNDFCTSEEIATRWGITTRRVQVMCTKGQIPGAVKFGHAWAIPANAIKPEDARVTTGEYKNWRKNKNDNDGGNE